LSWQFHSIVIELIAYFNMISLFSYLCPLLFYRKSNKAADISKNNGTILTANNNAVYCLYI